MRIEEFSNKLRTDISECVHDELKFESLTLRGSVYILSSLRSERVYILELSSSWDYCPRPLNKLRKASTQRTQSVPYTQSMKSWRMIVIFDELEFFH